MCFPYSAGTEGLIIDIRDNGGGYLSNVGKFVSRFIDQDVTGGYIRHKTDRDLMTFPSRSASYILPPAKSGCIIPNR